MKYFFGIPGIGGGIALNFHDWFGRFFFTCSLSSSEVVSLETARFVVGKGLMEHDEISQISPTSTYCSESLSQ